ncbi:unnamed protein product [Acanthosepion pharaonis]|uniref:Uncharacterized protein n=1 Tax=Acanthosepion pharaonis TaxID=158019 RepID=A0A812DVR3_ACAPH|nr:unnamed protein product [Sepia pharaonis]
MAIALADLVGHRHVVDEPPGQHVHALDQREWDIVEVGRAAEVRGAIRAPSSRTRLRLTPRPRRLTNDAPPLPLLTCEPIRGTAPAIRAGFARRRLPDEGGFPPRLTTVTAGRHDVRLRISVPVTTTSPVWVAGEVDRSSGRRVLGRPGRYGCVARLIDGLCKGGCRPEDHPAQAVAPAPDKPVCPGGSSGRQADLLTDRGNGFVRQRAQNLHVTRTMWARSNQSTCRGSTGGFLIGTGGAGQ